MNGRETMIRCIAGVAAIGSVIFLAATSGTAAPPAISCKTTADRVGRYEKVELVIDAPTDYTNPFDPEEVALAVRLAGPSGERIEIPAFYCQDYDRRRVGRGRRGRDWFYPAGPAGWKARFAPSQIGVYQAVAVLQDRTGAYESAAVRFACVESASRGFLRASSRDPRFFAFSTGEPFFAIGQNLAFIGSGQYVDLSKAEEIFATLAENGANWLRIWTCCQDWAMAIEARKSAWGRSWHWDPPWAPLPGAPAESDLRCVVLGADRQTVECSPSHPVALRPGTDYVLTGRVRTEGTAGLRLTVQGETVEIGGAGRPGAWADFEHPFRTAADSYWLGRLGLARAGDGRVWIDGLALREAAGGPNLLWEADVNRPALGRYNLLDCFLLDQLIEAAEAHGMYLQLCLLTRDRYMDRLKDPSSPAYAAAIRDAKRFFRYAVARWGYSTSVAAWEYWNEMDPGLPTDRFYTELGQYLNRMDVYHHLRKTSTWGPSARDARHPHLDVADVHFYLRPTERARLADEVAAVLDRAAFLRQHAPQKPALIGEFGLATDQWRLSDRMTADTELIHFHNSLWASALCGTSGTALFWWWDQLDRMNAYRHYRPVARFVADIPFTTAGLTQATATVSGAAVRVIGLEGRDRAYLWLFDPAAAWTQVAERKTPPREITGASVTWEDVAEGRYRVQWWDTREGTVTTAGPAVPDRGVLRVPVPPFRGDIACKIVPANG